MTRFRRLVLVAAVLVAGLAPARAEDAVKPQAPYEMVRSLQLLQDQIAQGNTAAQAAQPKLVTHIAEGFLNADPGAWQKPTNARALVEYLLSGGRPNVVRTLLDRGAISKDYLNLTKGALAYAEGRDEDARIMLGEVDARALPSNLGGHLALVQSMLQTEKDRAKMIQLLDLARLLVPGTLVEEAALRREIFALADAGNVSRFLTLSGQYALHFQNSVYADNFLQNFAASINKLGLTQDVRQVARIVAVVRELKPQDQRKLYLALARTAIVQGKNDIAGFASLQAVRLSKDQPREEARAKLYLGAALLLTDKYDEAIETLHAVERPRLPPSDAQLYDAVLGVAKVLHKDASVAGAEPKSDDAARAKPVAAAAPAKTASARATETKPPLPTRLASAPAAAASVPTVPAPAPAAPAAASPPVSNAAATIAAAAAVPATDAVPPEMRNPPPGIDLAEKALADADLLLKDTKK